MYFIENTYSITLVITKVIQTILYIYVIYNM